MSCNNNELNTPCQREAMVAAALDGIERYLQKQGPEASSANGKNNADDDFMEDSMGQYRSLLRMARTILLETESASQPRTSKNDSISELSTSVRSSITNMKFIGQNSQDRSRLLVWQTSRELNDAIGNVLKQNDNSNHSKEILVSSNGPASAKHALEANLEDLYQEIESLMWGLNDTKIDIVKAQELLENLCATLSDCVLEAFRALLLCPGGTYVPTGLDFSDVESLRGWERARNLGLVERADAGDMRAQHLVSRMHYMARGVPKDNIKSFRYAWLSAKQGHSTGQAQVGFSFLRGVGVKPDYKRAFEHFEKSVKSGSLLGQFWQAICFRGGHGVTHDYAKALQIFSSAASGGFIYAYFWIGGAYYFGKGVARDSKKALYYFRRGADSGCPHSLNRMGILYQHGRAGVMKDAFVARKFYEMAALRGKTYAWLDCGKMFKSPHEFDIELPPNGQQALRCFQLARMQQVGPGFVEAGKLLSSGWSALHDFSASKQYLESLYGSNIRCDGNVEATAMESHLLLGFMSQHGLVEYVDRGKALHHFEIAAEKNSSSAYYSIGCLALETGEKASRREAIESLIKAASEGEILARARIIKMQLVEGQSEVIGSMFLRRDEQALPPQGLMIEEITGALFLSEFANVDGLFDGFIN